MVSSSGGYLDNFPLLENLPGRRHEVYAASDGLLDLQELLELLDPLHGVVGVSSGLTNLLQSACNTIIVTC